MCVITDKSSVLGKEYIGGTKTSTELHTKNIFESAYFVPSSIRKTSRELLSILMQI